MTTKTRHNLALVEAASWPTLREIAETYDVPLRWVQDQVALGRVPAVRINVLRINPDDWNTFLMSRQPR